jgi:hypothetical protein
MQEYYREGIRLRVARHRARQREAVLERERRADWSFATGEHVLALTPCQVLALWAWRCEYGIRGEFGRVGRTGRRVARAYHDPSRYLRMVRLKDGTRCLMEVARAVGPAYSIPITPELNVLYLELLAQEFQRWCRRLSGDWTETEDFNRAVLKLPLSGRGAN